MHLLSLPFLVNLKKKYEIVTLKYLEEFFENNLKIYNSFIGELEWKKEFSFYMY